MRLSPSQTSRAFLAVLALAVSFCAAGCSKPNGTVTGKVYYKDKVVKGGNVIFAPATGPTVTAEIGEDGSYTIEKVPAGPVKIAVDTTGYKPPMAGGPGMPPERRFNPYPADAKDKPNQVVDPAEKAKRYTALPEKYEDPKNSGKEYTVTSGKQDHDIKLD
jgi:hypothetical protein